MARLTAGGPAAVAASDASGLGLDGLCRGHQLLQRLGLVGRRDGRHDEYPRLDSNQQPTAPKAAASTSWATRADQPEPYPRKVPAVRPSRCAELWHGPGQLSSHSNLILVGFLSIPANTLPSAVLAVTVWLAASTAVTSTWRAASSFLSLPTSGLPLGSRRLN